MEINTTLLNDNEKRLCLALSNEAKDIEALLEQINQPSNLCEHIIKNINFDYMLSARTQFLFIRLEIEQREKRLLNFCHTGK